MRSPTCNQPCRICHTEATALGTIPNFDITEAATLDHIVWPVRSVNTTMDIVMAAQEGAQDSEADLITNGLSYYMVMIKIIAAILMFFY